jgi:chromosome segregation ATPase
MAALTQLEVWKANSFCSHTNDEKDEGETGVEILKTKEGPDEASPLIQNQFRELREYPKETFEPATVSDRRLTKLMPHWLKKHSVKKEMPLHREIETIKGDTRALAKTFGEVCQNTAALEGQLNLIAVEQGKLRKDRGALMNEPLSTSEERETVKENIDALNLEVELQDQCKKTASLEDQLNQMRVEGHELRKDIDALIYEAIIISEEKETMKKDRDALNLEVEELRGQCKKVADLEDQLNQMRVERDELRKDIDALTYEAIIISEEKDNIKLDRDVLKLEIENIRIEFGRKY